MQHMRTSTRSQGKHVYALHCELFLAQQSLFGLWLALSLLLKHGKEMCWLPEGDSLQKYLGAVA